MDGLPHSLPRSITLQRTLKTAIPCVGVGLHGGRRTRMVLRPAPIGAGIVFHRADLGIDIPARYDLVADTRLCTMLAAPGRPDVRVGTVEHVMAALAGCGVTNAVVELDGPEVPILDGSSAGIVFLLDCAGTVEQDAPATAVEVLRPVRVGGRDAWVELRPIGYGAPGGLEIDLSIAFDAPAIGEQHLVVRVTPEAFRSGLARARTFTLLAEVEALRAAGLALGGSLDNAVVVDGARVLNPAGLRRPDEFVRHKVLDAVGDLALAGAALIGQVVGHRSGHALNNRLLHALFADADNWRPVTGVAEPGAGMRLWPDRRLPIAAAPS